MKHFTSVHDVENVSQLVQDALQLKQHPMQFHHLGQHKTVGLIFMNPSFRTRMSTQKAASNLGMHCMVMNLTQDGWNLEFEDGAIMNGTRAEHVKDAAAVISSYCDMIGLRSFPSLSDREADYTERVLEQFKKYSSVPVISLESATRHPLQSLADMMTIEENSQNKTRPKVVLSWAPHVKALPQAVANSFSEWVQKKDVEFVIAHPTGYELHESFTSLARIEHDQHEAFEGADFIYVKNWSKYAPYGEIETEKYAHWMPDKSLFHLAPEARIMHCLPVRRNVELSDELLDHPNALVQQQALNRVYAAQAVLKKLLDMNS